ncbi:MAG: hypothetical protein ACEPOV_02990 [Hyphomicrobiales bacterium]
MEIYYFSKKTSKTPHSFEPYYMRYNFIWADRSYYDCHTALCLHLSHVFDTLNMDEVICALKLVTRDDKHKDEETEENLKYLFEIYENYYEHKDYAEELDNENLETFNLIKDALMTAAENNKENISEYSDKWLTAFNAHDLKEIMNMGRVLNIKYPLHDFYEQTSQLPILSRIARAIVDPEKILLLDYKKIDKDKASLIAEELKEEFKMKDTLCYPIFNLPIISDIDTEDLKTIRRDMLQHFSGMKNRITEFKKAIEHKSYSEDYRDITSLYNRLFYPEWLCLQPKIESHYKLKEYYKLNKLEAKDYELSMTVNVFPLKMILSYFVKMEIINKGHDDFIKSLLPKHINEDTPVTFLSLTFGTIYRNLFTDKASFFDDIE